MTYYGRTSSEPYFDKFKEYEIDEPKTPLDVSRIRVVLELEIDTDVTSYDSHQIILTHPDMDGALKFDVSGLSDAEDKLDEFDYTMRDEYRSPIKKVEEKKVDVSTTPPKPFTVHSQPYVAPVRPVSAPPSVAKTEPISAKEDPNPKTNSSMIGDVIEICQLFGKIRVSGKNLNDNLKKK